MIKIDFEPGYTPGNLKRIRKRYNLTLSEVSILTDSKIRTVQRWETDVDSDLHSDMPLKKWLSLLASLD